MTKAFPKLLLGSFIHLNCGPQEPSWSRNSKRSMHVFSLTQNQGLIVLWGKFQTSITLNLFNAAKTFPTPNTDLKFISYFKQDVLLIC